MTIALCSRCFAPCRISDRQANPDAKPLRLAGVNEKGLCASCALTAFIKGVEVLALGIERNGIQILLRPDIQGAYAELFGIGNSDADIREIDWQSVIENWNLS